METGWCPETFTAPFLEVWKCLAQFSTTPPFYSLGYIAHRILRRIFYEQMNMIHVHCHIKILASLTDNTIQRKRDIANQDLPAVLRREDHMVCQE
jgi:hypothetical protein